MTMKTELPNGVVVHQVTEEERLVSNIYCERPFCSADSRRFLYSRQLNGGGHEDLNDWEYVLCEFETWEEEIVGRGLGQVSISYTDDFYFQRPMPGGQLEFVRLDMSTGDVTPVWACPPDVGRAGHPTVTLDRRLLAYHYAVSFDPQLFGIAVVDLQTGERNIVCERSDLCNAHLQFHPTDNRTLLVQVNRGCEFAAEGKRLKLVGDEGATLLLLDAVSGETHDLPIGKPHTPPITGHEAWVGSSEDVIATVSGQGEYGTVPGGGSTLLVARDTPCRQLGTGIVLNHIGSSPCGRYFWGDRISSDYIAIGSPVTGRTVTVHDDPSQPGGSPFGQQSHPHAYLTPDFNWMVFNSDSTGRPQIYAARIPGELLAQLDDEA